MSDLNLKAIEQPAISVTISEQIRGLIIDGSLRPGQPLSESKVANQLGVSRGPVREALQLLVQEGLLVRIPNRGVFVAEITSADVAEIYEAREALEVRCGLKLLRGDRKKRERVVRDLQSIVDRIGPAEQARKWPDVVRRDLDFHTRLVHAADNSRIERAYSTLIAESYLSINRLERWYPEAASLHTEHQAIVDALASGDEQAFITALGTHYVPTH